MRPFRFFFAFSLAILIFFFFARFLVLAAFAAAILSFFFFVFRKMRRFLHYSTWEERRHDYRSQYRSALPEVQYDEEPLFYNREIRPEKLGDFRSIEVQ